MRLIESSRLGPNSSRKGFIEFLQVEMAQLLAQLFVLGTLLFAWNVFFAGRAACALCGNHPGTLARSGPRRYWLHVVIRSAKAFGLSRLL